MNISKALGWARTTGGFVTVLAVSAIGGVGGAVLVTGSHSPAPASVVVRQVSDMSTPTATDTATPTETETVAPVVVPTTEAPAPVESTQAPAPVATSVPEVIVPKVVEPAPAVAPAPAVTRFAPPIRPEGNPGPDGSGQLYFPPPAVEPPVQLTPDVAPTAGK